MHSPVTGWRARDCEEQGDRARGRHSPRKGRSPSTVLLSQVQDLGLCETLRILRSHASLLALEHPGK
jgi:hypothetical protein